MASSASTTSGEERPSGAPRDTSAVPGAAAAPPQAHAEWAASMQAYYATGGQPYAWHAAAQQHMIAAAAAAGAPYGTPVPFPMSFHPAYYAHPALATGVPYPASDPVAVAEGKSKTKISGAPSVGSAPGSSDGRSEELSDKRDASAEHKLFPSAKRRKSSSADVQGEPSQAATMQDAAAKTRSAAKRSSAAKLSVSTPDTEAISNSRPNLNIGMDLWSSSPVKAESSGQGEINAAAPSQHDVALSQMDERELKRERRKQSNRESARRSRLRKQQECEELAQKVTDLTAINGTLRSELDQLKKACEDMQAENSQLMGEMDQAEAPCVVTTLSIQIDTSKARHGNNDSSS
ncbi:hypothetical protein BAE44_0022072 [Dichanthelium oligosanthes]|uniref:BZIP domain-containing protein n=1 Tax=Dichanthelium oligosanthes TaxID=888268 RepID=A0A1E5UVK4_9POAL|nr:hypothetical protein BAE44_0022072 [Dichanthelium oligosanthes]